MSRKSSQSSPVDPVGTSVFPTAVQDTFVHSGFPAQRCTGKNRRPSASPAATPVPSPEVLLPTLPDALLNRAQAAALLGVSGKTLQRMVARREITYIDIGRGTRKTYRFERPAIDVFIARRRVRGAA